MSGPRVPEPTSRLVGWMRIGPRRLAAAAMLAGTLVAVPAMAQMPYLLHEGPSMSREDMQAMHVARDRLLAMEPPPIGRVESWSNPQSGAHGSIILEAASEYRGMPCRRLRYVIVTRHADSAVGIVMRSCRQPDGVWKFA